MQRSRSGLSMIEVMLSVILFAIFMIGLAPTMTAAIVLRRQSDTISQAANLAQQQIEAIRADWQQVNYHISNSDYIGNNLAGLQSALPVVGAAYNFGKTAAGGTVDRSFSWFPAGSALPAGTPGGATISSGQFADLAPTDNGSVVLKANSQFVIRTTVQAEGPVSFCTGATGTANQTLPCADADGGGNTAMFNPIVGNPDAGALSCGTACPPISASNNVRLFKRVTVAVFRSDVDGCPMGANPAPAGSTCATGPSGAAPIRPLRSASSDSVIAGRTSAGYSTSRFWQGPLVVVSTNF